RETEALKARVSRARGLECRQQIDANGEEIVRPHLERACCLRRQAPIVGEERSIAHRGKPFDLLHDRSLRPEVAALRVKSDQPLTGARVEWKARDEGLHGARVQATGRDVVCHHARRIAGHQLIRPEGLALEEKSSRQAEVRVQRVMKDTLESFRLDAELSNEPGCAIAPQSIVPPDGLAAAKG